MAQGVPWPEETVRRAIALLEEGLSSYRVAAQLGVPRASVANWACGRTPITREALARDRCRDCGGRKHPISDGRAYSYLLGMYLGDGCLATRGKNAYLCVALDACYPGIVDETQQAITRVLAFRRSSLRKDPRENLLVLRSYGREWLCLFPQHGPGRKHHRKIELQPWQQSIVDEHTGPFLRGLIHSDGWRGVNRVTVTGRDYAYPRYQFSNRSDDIRRIFCDACDHLGVAWRPWGRWHVSVARRNAVALLDEHVGLKR